MGYPKYTEAARYFPQETRASTPPVYTFPTGGGGVILISAGGSSNFGTAFTFIDSNNVSFGISDGSITASFPGFTQGSVSAGISSEDLSNLVFANSNSISFGLSNGTITATVAYPTVSSPYVFVNSNGISFGTNVSTVTASYTVPTDYVSTGQSSLFQHTSAMSNYLGTAYTTHTHSQYINTSQSSLFEQTSHTTVFLTTQLNQAFSAQGGSSTFQTLNFVNSNGFTFSNSNGSVVGSYTVPTVTNSSWTVSAGTTSGSVSQLVFSNSNSVSFGLNAGTITATVSYPLQSNQTLGLYASSQTTAQSSSSTFDARSITVRGMGNVSVGFSAGELVISATGGAGGGIALANSETTYNTGTVNLSALGALTINSTTGQYFQFSVPNTSSISGTGHVSISVNASTISIGAPSPAVSGSNGSFSYSTLTLGNLNGMSFYTSNGSIVGSYTVPSTAGLLSAINLSAGTTSNNLSAVTFSDSNGVSFGLSGSVITATVATNYQSQGAYLTTAAQSTQTNAFSLGGNTGTTNSSVMSAGGYVIAGGSNVTLSMSNNSLSIHAATNALTTQSNQTIGLYASSQTTGQSSSSTVDARSLTFRGAGIVSVGLSGGEFIISATGGGGGLTNINLSAGTTSNNLSNFVLSDSNGISFGLNGSTVTASHNGITSQSNQNISLYALGNTTQNSSTVLNASNLSFNALGSFTVGYSNGSIQLSAPNALTSQSNQAFSAQGGSSAFQTLVFTNSNGVSFSNTNGSVWASVETSYAASNHSHGNPTLALTNLSGTTASNSAGLTLSLSAAAPGAAAENNWHHLLGANTAGNTTASGSTIGLSGINLTLSGTNGSAINISAPATSSLSGTGQVSISVNASTISIGVPDAVTYSRYNEFKESPMVAGEIGQASLHLQPWLIPNLHMDRIVIHKAFSNASNSSNSFTVSDWVGIYTRTGSTLSLLHSASASTNFTGSGTVGSYLSYGGGIKAITMGLTQTLTEGMYWIGVIQRTTTGGGAGHTLNQVLNSQMNSSYRGLMGVATNATNQLTLGFGVYTVSTSGMPNSIAFTQINGNSSVFLRPPSLYFISGTI